MKRFLLDTLYPKVLDGLPVLGTPQELAASIRDGGGSAEEQIERLVRRHIALSSATGFVTGLGGWLTLPITLPADLVGVALLQLHMAASVAALAGHDPTLPVNRERVIGCLVGVNPEDDGRDIEQETIDRTALKVAEKGLNFVISNVGQLMSWGTKKVVEGQIKRRLIRGVPVIGGVIGAVSDGYVTAQVSRAARDTFFGGIEEPDDPTFPPSSGDGLPEGVVSPSTPSEA